MIFLRFKHLGTSLCKLTARKLFSFLLGHGKGTFVFKFRVAWVLVVYIVKRVFVPSCLNPSFISVYLGAEHVLRGQATRNWLVLSFSMLKYAESFRVSCCAGNVSDNKSVFGALFWRTGCRSGF